MASSDPGQRQQDPEEVEPDGDPDTGSTPQDPSVDGTGLPPEGTDPMAGGAAPSG